MTDNAAFWMHPDLLYYLNEYDFESDDKLIAGILNDSIAAISRFLMDYNMNQIYYDSLIEGKYYDDAEIPNDIIMIILGFLCHYDGIDPYLLKEEVCDDDVFAIEAIKGKVDDLMIGIQDIFSNDIADEEESICSVTVQSNSYQLMGEQRE